MGVLVDLAEVREARAQGHEPRLTKRDVCAVLGISERTCENWMRRGMPHEKPFANGSVRFVWSDVEAWMRR